MRNKKPFYQSKTLWLNTLVAIFTMLEAQFHLIQPQLEPAHYMLLIAGLSGLNMFLRTITEQAVRFKRDAE